MSEGRWAYFTGSDSETAYHFAHDDEPYHDAAVAAYLNALEHDLQEALDALEEGQWAIEELRAWARSRQVYLNVHGIVANETEIATGERIAEISERVAALLARHRKEGADAS